MAKHDVIKVKQEVKRRTLTVTAAYQLTPRMRRIECASAELSDFLSPSPDDHIKIFLPSEDGEPVMRDFTPRSFSQADGTLVLDFALHEHGPASDWARRAKPGDRLAIGGPRGSTIVPDDFDWYLMIGDAAAIPSIGRRLESLRASVPVTTLILVQDAEEQQEFVTQADWTPQWVFPGNDESSGSPLQLALKKYRLPDGDGFAWIAAEASESRGLYQTLVEEMCHPAGWTKASTYWTDDRATRQ